MIRTVLLALTLILGLAVVQPVVMVSAESAASQIKNGVDEVGGDENQLSFSDAIKRAVNILLFLIGAISVVMIIFGGFKYVTSQGDANAVGSAKNTVLYAVIGLIVALLAYAIANFAVKAFTK